MSFLIGLVLVIAVLFVIFSGASKKNTVKDGQTPIKARRVLTLNEQPTFNRLRESLPNHIILAQVAFSALITSKGYATRSRFNRKVADFVVLDKTYNVVAIVELDDASHIGREDQDADRDAMLMEAGYRVIRYQRTPDITQIKQDFGVKSVKRMRQAEAV